MTGKRRKARTAAEVMEQLAADPDYQRRIAEKERQSRERSEMLTLAEQPILADLAAVGIVVESVWDLVATSTPYPKALPVLLNHLEVGGYPDWVLASMARALAVKPAVEFWPKLQELFLNAAGPSEQDAIAAALAASATPDQVENLMLLVRDDTLSDARIHFLRPIKRYGGPEGLAFVETLKDSQTFGKEASAILRSNTPSI